MFDVELVGVTKRFRDTTAVDNVSLQISNGELFSLLGPSGCGKTTTLRMIAGLEKPTEGIITIKGTDVTYVPPYKRDTAMVFQNWALFPHKTVFDNIAFGLKMRHLPRDEIRMRVRRMLELVQLTGYENKMPGQLSGGQQQRIALARALVVEPAVLLLDEPLANLDLKLRQQMRLEVKQIQEKFKVTTVFVTHDQTEAITMSDRMAIMSKGRVEQVGSPNEVFEKPGTEFVAEFLGETNSFVVETMGAHGSDAAAQTESGLGLKLADIKARDKKFRVFVRPDRIEMSRSKSILKDNTYRGRIARSTYMGGLTRYYIVVSDRDTIFLDIPTSQDPNLKPGDEVLVGWDAEDQFSFALN